MKILNKTHPELIIDVLGSVFDDIFDRNVGFIQDIPLVRQIRRHRDVFVAEKGVQLLVPGTFAVLFILKFLTSFISKMTFQFLYSVSISNMTSQKLPWPNSSIWRSVGRVRARRLCGICCFCQVDSTFRPSFANLHPDCAMLWTRGESRNESG